MRGAAAEAGRSGPGHPAAHEAGGSQGACSFPLILYPVGVLTPRVTEMMVSFDR